MTYEELTGRLSGREEMTGWDYAVLVPVVEEGGKLSLLFEVRAATLRHQPGEVCFPGGAAEPGESPEETALRETAEELGLGREKVELGPRLPRQRHQAGFYTRPVVGHILPGWREALKPNAAEVGEVFTVPLDFFRETPPEEYTCEVVTVPPADFPHEKLGFPGGYQWRKGKRTVLVWMWQGRPIWGLTARMVRSLVEAL